MGRRTFLQSVLGFGFAAGGVAICMMAKAAEAMTVVVPRSAFPLPLGELIEQAQFWGGDDEDWRHRHRWHDDEDDDDEDEDDD
jgi:hypothetical protein